MQDKTVVLTKPPITKYPIGWKLYAPMVPMGLAYIGAALQRAGISFHIVDNYANSYKAREFDNASFVRTLQEVDPSVVGISCMSIEYLDCLQLIELIRQNCSAQIVVGGPHATLFPELFSDIADFVVVGEGEYALMDIVKSSIKAEHQKGNVISYPRIASLDELAMNIECDHTHLIPWEYINLDTYCNEIPQWSFQTAPIVNLNTSRGCSYSCRFCSILGIWTGGMRALSARFIFREMMYLRENFGIKAICFREDNFAGYCDRIRDLCTMLIRAEADIEWAAELRVDAVNEALLKSMAEANCNCLMFGVETGSDRMLKEMKKGTTVEQIRRAFKLCHKFGIKTLASVIYGLPGETEEDRQTTLQLLDEICPTFTEASVFLGIPGSDYYNELKHNRDYEYYDSTTLHIYPKGYKEIRKRYVGNGDDEFLPY